MIRYLHHNDLDKEKWDHCIENAPNGTIYAMSWYLDRICPGWCGLISGDYEQVMPLPVNRRLGLSYAYTPFYAQQLGVFGADAGERRVGDFLNSIPAFIRLADIRFNEQNTVPEGKYRITARKNYILSLASGYDKIRDGYNRNCKRNIKKAAGQGLKPGESMDAGQFARFIRDNLEHQMEGLGAGAIRVLENITRECLDRGRGEVTTVRDEKDAVCAAGSFLFQRDRLIFSVCASTPEGRQKQAMYMLVDEQIQQSAGKYNSFDFSGSDMEGIAYFNATFGARPVYYHMVHINRLNRIQRLLSGKFQ